MTGTNSSTHRRPLVKHVMTAFPFAIDKGANASEALAMMKEHDIAHLPVLSDGELAGILSDRDLARAEAWRSASPNRAQGAAEVDIPVGMLCTIGPHTVELDEPLQKAAREMAARGIGSILVTRKGRLAGILTTTDTNAFLADLLDDLFGALPEGDDAA